MLIGDDIKIGIGIGSIRFGISQEDLKNIIGMPSSINDESYSDGDVVRKYTYERLNVVFSFSSEDSYKLSSIDFSSRYFKVGNRSLIGLSLHKFLEQMEEFNFETPSIDSIGNENEENHLMLYYDKEGLVVDFIDYFSVAVSINPLWKNENEIIWPLEINEIT